MKEFFRRCSSVMLDLRVIVGICGALISVTAHELFHIMTHWGEIQNIALVPDAHAVVEVTFNPSRPYDLVVEEAIAYTITMIVLVLTIKLIYEINDNKNSKTICQMIPDGLSPTDCLDLSDPATIDHLATLLGVSTLSVSGKIKH